MSGHLTSFNQEEYSRVLNEHGGQRLSNSQCMRILMEHGANHNQAKNGAYTYIHHRNHLQVQQKGWQGLYDQILDEYDGMNKTNIECIRHLEEQGYSQGQAKNAAYNYRRRKGLVKQR